MPYAAESIATTAVREAKKIWPLLAGLSFMGVVSYKATSGAAAAPVGYDSALCAAP